MKNNFLEIENVTFAASSKNKVNNVSFNIENEGDIVCLLGPSGIGKTTILRTIAGLVIKIPACVCTELGVFEFLFTQWFHQNCSDRDDNDDDDNDNDNDDAVVFMYGTLFFLWMVHELETNELVSFTGDGAFNQYWDCNVILGSNLGADVLCGAVRPRCQWCR